MNIIQKELKVVLMKSLHRIRLKSEVALFRASGWLSWQSV